MWVALWLTACTALGGDTPSYPDEQGVEGDLSTQPWDDLMAGADEDEDGATDAPRCADGIVPEQAVVRPTDAEPRGGELQTLREGTRLLLPLRQTTFDSQVTGTIATTRVEQVFINPYDDPIEAVYVFPLPHDAAVHAYSMTIDDRTIEGQIERRQKARDLYEQAKQEGRATALLDQQRPNIFTQHVANIPPGETIAVALTMTGPVTQRGTVSRLSLPTVVGPRYIPGTPVGRSGPGVGPDTDRVADGSHITPPRLPPGTVPCASLRIRVQIDAGLPIVQLASKTHAIEKAAKHGRHVVELASDQQRLDRDFVLSWRADVPRPRASMLVHADGDERYFSLTVFPPERTVAPPPVPRELVFVVDTSGSMSGEPLAVAKAAMRQLLASLSPADAFRIVRFSTDAGVMSDAPLPATKANLKRAAEYVAQLDADGGTDMQRWIDVVFDEPPARDRVRHVVLLSDGYVGDEEWIFSEVHQNLRGARVFGLGVGNSVNRYLIDGLARAGGGAAFYVGRMEPTGPAIRRFYDALAYPVLTDLAIDWGDLEVEDVVFGSARDLFVGQPVVVYGRLRSDHGGQARIRGRANRGTIEIPFEVDPAAATSHQAIEAMWARAAVGQQQARRLADPGAVEAIEAEITRLGLRHGLVTAHTSFVAVDTVSTASGETKRVVVPVEGGHGAEAGAQYYKEISSMKKLESQSRRLVELERRQVAQERARLLELERRAHEARWRDELRVCLEPERLGAPWTGVLKVRIEVDREGNVESITFTADPEGSQTIEGAIEQCVTKVAKTWTLTGRRSSTVELRVEEPQSPGE